MIPLESGVEFNPTPEEMAPYELAEETGGTSQPANPDETSSSSLYINLRRAKPQPLEDLMARYQQRSDVLRYCVSIQAGISRSSHVAHTHMSLESTDIAHGLGNKPDLLKALSVARQTPSVKEIIQCDRSPYVCHYPSPSPPLPFLGQDPNQVHVVLLFQVSLVRLVRTISFFRKLQLFAFVFQIRHMNKVFMRQTDFTSTVKSLQETRGVLVGSDLPRQVCQSFERALLLLRALKNAKGKEVVGVMDMHQMFAVMYCWEKWTGSVLPFVDLLEKETTEGFEEAAALYLEFLKDEVEGQPVKVAEVEEVTKVQEKVEEGKEDEKDKEKPKDDTSTKN